MMRIPVTAMGWGHFAVTGRVTVLEEWGVPKAPPMEAGAGRWAGLHLTLFGEVCGGGHAKSPAQDGGVRAGPGGGRGSASICSAWFQPRV